MIALYNLEPKYFNLVLEKIRKYYEDQGEKVDDYKPLWHNKYDKIYCSSIFTWTDKSMVTSDMICGGTGFDLTTKLPSEIEKIKVYKNKGFTSRGCNRNCPFCVVPQKEGKFKITGNIYDFWDQKSNEIVLYDPNILWDKKHFEAMCSITLAHDLWIEFNGGLDIRLFDNDVCELLYALKIKVIYLAWDQMKSEKIITRKVKLLKEWGLSNCMFYILVGFDTTIKEDLYRRNKINEWGYDAFFMSYNNRKDGVYPHLTRWNNRFVYRSQSFEDYLKARKLTYLLSQDTTPRRP